MPKHFTPYKTDTITTYETGKEPVDHVAIPMHSIGHGWKRGIVELAEGDTAVNVASTKPERVLRGPGVVVYDVHRSGISAVEYDDASSFYDDIGKFFIVGLTEGENGQPQRLAICATEKQAMAYIETRPDYEDGRYYIDECRQPVIL